MPALAVALSLVLVLVACGARLAVSTRDGAMLPPTPAGWVVEGGTSRSSTIPHARALAVEATGEQPSAPAQSGAAPASTDPPPDTGDERRVAAPDAGPRVTGPRVTEPNGAGSNVTGPHVAEPTVVPASAGDPVVASGRDLPSGGVEDPGPAPERHARHEHPPPDEAPTPGSPQPGEWRAMRTHPDGRPVRYDPCTPIEYVTRLDIGPEFARRELVWAIGQVEQASGLDLVWVGDVDEPYSGAWPASAPLHLGFATEAEFAMPPGASGYGDSTAVEIDGRYRYVGGRVVLRPDHGWTESTASVNPLGLMFLHELGHVVGLGHVASPDEVMSDAGNGTARSLGPGDRAGLAAVGRPAGCLS